MIWAKFILSQLEAFLISSKIVSFIHLPVCVQESLASTYSMQQHMHSMRSQRVEEDVYHVRAAEVMAHKAWVARHVNGMYVRFEIIGTIAVDLSL